MSVTGYINAKLRAGYELAADIFAITVASAQNLGKIQAYINLVFRGSEKIWGYRWGYKLICTNKNSFKNKGLAQ